MKTFLDSSAFAKRFVDEPGSDTVDAICLESDELALSILCVPEILSALNCRLREKTLSLEQYNEAKRRLLTEVEDAVIVNLTSAVIAISVEILEESRVRAMDALQIACAKQWAAELFASSDKRQIAAAEKAGLRARWVSG